MAGEGEAGVEVEDEAEVEVGAEVGAEAGVEAEAEAEAEGVEEVEQEELKIDPVQLWPILTLRLLKVLYCFLISLELHIHDGTDEFSSFFDDVDDDSELLKADKPLIGIHLHLPRVM